jgi:hypothetical protein
MAKKNFNVEGLLAHAKKQSQETQDSIRDNIQIMEELKLLIPPLKEEEYQQLEQNIISEGCRESLLLWHNEDKYVLIDGHNRYQICQKHGISFPIKLIDFPDIEEVKTWMINNQLGRRNLTLEQQSYLRGKRYDNEKLKVSNPYGVKGIKGQNDLQFIDLQDEGQNVLHLNTAQRLAQELNVSEKTIKRDADFAKGLDKIGESNPQLKQNILSGKSNIKKAEVQKISKLSKEEINKIKTEEDLINRTQSQSKVVKPPPTEPSLEIMLEALGNSVDGILLEVKGSFLLKNNLADYWQKLRKLKTPITEDFTDYLTWGQAKAIGLVK